MDNSFRMPGEWERHRATWIAWPHSESDFPGKLNAIQWVYTEIVRLLGQSELVEILVQDAEQEELARGQLLRSGVRSGYRFHRVPTDRSWLRDSGATAVVDSSGKPALIGWRFSAWAKYDDFARDASVPQAMAKVSGHPLIPAMWRGKKAADQDGDVHVGLEGGAIDVDGCGTLLTTEQCLLSDVQERNPGFTREDYEGVFAKYLGTTKTIWLAGSCVGDDTHGHIDDAARFVAPGKVVVAYEEDPTDPNHEVSRENVRILESTTDARGKSLEVIRLPFPSPLEIDGDRVPASYANFYIGNSTVVVPTFNDVKDRLVLGKLAELFPDRKVVGVHAVDLVLGFGTLHCLSQQEILSQEGVG